MGKTIGRFVYDSATAQSVAAGGNLPLTASTATCGLSCDGETVTISRAGEYLVAVDATLAATAAGTVETQLYRNGNAVPGAHAYSTAAAAGDYAAQAYATVVSVPACGQATVNVKAATATGVVVANLVVVRL